MSGAQEQRHEQKIVTIPGKNAFLDLIDRLDPDPKRSKIKWFIVNYGDGPSVTAQHYMDPGVFKVLAGDILRDVFPKHYPDGWREYKGSEVDGNIQSRILRIACDTSKKYPYLIQIDNGPGEKLGNGAVKPSGPPESSVRFVLSRAEMHRLFREGVDYIFQMELLMRGRALRRGQKDEE